MILNTKTAQEIREYYITLEEIFYSYLEYTKDFYLNIEKSLHKDNQIKQIETII